MQHLEKTIKPYFYHHVYWGILIMILVLFITLYMHKQNINKINIYFFALLKHKVKINI